jgi:spoIIIJ-associated protein
MPDTMDKVAAANQINDFLKLVVAQGGLRLKYRIMVDPPGAADGEEFEQPWILVDFGGPDSSLLLDRGAELLRSLETLAHEILDLHPDEHDRVIFDSRNYRTTRLQELRLAAKVAAEEVRKNNAPYEFAPMSSRERRIVHLALRSQSDLHTESQGEGPGRRLVVFPAGYDPAKYKPMPVLSRRRR